MGFRFFASDSYWNRPISTGVDRMSDHYINLLKQEPTGGLYMSCNAYTMPIYWADENTPRYTIHQRVLSSEEASHPDYLKFKGDLDRFSMGPGFGENVPIPDVAIPCPGSDAHMAIVDEASGRVWDMWGVCHSEEGEWSANTGMVYPMDGDGIFDSALFDIGEGDSIHFYGPSRASGTPAVAGVVLYEEVLRGEINHKLAFASRFNGSKEYIYPACWTDGHFVGGLPEGCILQLDPYVDLSAYSLSPAEKVICVALQKYGAVNIDNAEGTALSLEYLGVQEGRNWSDVLNPESLKQIPLDFFRIVELGEVFQGGDKRIPKHLYDNIGWRPLS